MEQHIIIREAEEWVKKLLRKDTSGHDWHHVNQVRKLALTIAKSEKADLFLVELTALFHEVPDKKLKLFKDEATALLKVRKWLEKREVAEDHVEEILYVIKTQSFSKSGVTSEKLESKAGQVMQDADRLEALGAIGIARCFAWGGKKGRPVYDPAIPPTEHITEKDILSPSGSSINHFYEKLLKIKGLMNTPTGRKLAEGRHIFTEKFLEQFFAEWDGKK